MNSKNVISSARVGWEYGPYEAQLVKIESKKSDDLVNGGRFYFRAVSPPVGANHNLCFYTLPLESEDNKPSDGGFSLKTVLYYLQCGIENGTEIAKLIHLVGRYVNLIIKTRNINGKMIPVICGFQFSTFELFRINGSHHKLEPSSVSAC
jgi:hypothetical protein